MQQINLNLSSELYINDKNQISIKPSTDEGNTLQIIKTSLEEDGCGLFAEAKQGSSGTEGTTYPNGEMEGIIIGAKGPWGGFYTEDDYTEYDQVVSVASYVHRTYTALHALFTEQGYFSFPASYIADMRECDYITPGDFVRVPVGEYNSLDEIPSDEKYHYYIVVDTSRNIGEDGYPEPRNDAKEAYLLSNESW